MLALIFYLPDELLVYVQRVVLSRFEWGEDGLRGDNRETAMLLNYYSIWLNSNITVLLLGINDVLNGDLGSSWRIILLGKSIIGLVLILLLLGWIRIRFKYDGFVFLMVFIASMYQRPFILHLSYFLLFFWGAGLFIIRKSWFGNIRCP